MDVFCSQCCVQWVKFSQVFHSLLFCICEFFLLKENVTLCTQKVITEV